MKIISSLIIFAFLIASCKKDTKALDIKVTALATSIKTQEINILEAKKAIAVLTTKLNTKRDSINEFYVHKDTLKETLPNGLGFITNPKEVITQFFNENNIASGCGFEYTLFENELLLKKNNDSKKFIIEDALSIIDISIYYFDRGAENINSFFSDTMLTTISEILSYKVYKKSGLKYSLEALLTAYDNLNDAQLDTLYKICTLKKLPNEAYKNGAIDSDVNLYKMKFINTIVSQDVITILRQDPNYEAYNFNAYERNIYSAEEDCGIDGMPNKLFYTYSFWARRYKEGNKDVVYKVLKSFVKKMNNNQ